MGSDDIFNKEYINQLKEIQAAVNIAKSPAIQEAIRITKSPSIQQTYQAAESVKMVSEHLSMVSASARNCLKALLPENISEQYLQMSHIIADTIQPITQLYSYEQLEVSLCYLRSALPDYNLMYCYPDDMSDEDIAESEEINNKVVTEIFKPDGENDRNTNKKESAIIMLSPINEKVLRYLAENPESFCHLEDKEFEAVMAEIYSKLGYKVELTKATRDGGKDIIIRKPEILGDFVYYVECKKYAAQRHIGVGIIRNLVGTINADRVNGGILATTSYFTPDAKRFISDNKYDYQIQMHDYDAIRKMLDRIV